MGDFTTRRGFYRPGSGPFGAHGDDESADIDRISDSFSRLDQLTGAPILASVGAYPNPLKGDRCIVGDVEYRYNGSIWRAWDSEWITTTAGWNNIGFQTDNTPQFRYHAGAVGMRVYSTNLVTNAGGGGALLLTVPVPVAAGGTSPLPIGRARRIIAGGQNPVPMTLSFFDLTHVQFAYADAGNPDREILMRTNNVGGGEDWDVAFEYSPF